MGRARGRTPNLSGKEPRQVWARPPPSRGGANTCPSACSSVALGKLVNLSGSGFLICKVSSNLTSWDGSQGRRGSRG